MELKTMADDGVARERWAAATLIEPAPGEGNNKMQPEAGELCPAKRKVAASKLPKPEPEPEPELRPSKQAGRNIYTVYYYISLFYTSLICLPLSLYSHLPLCACDI